MVHFPGFARTRLWIQRAVVRFDRTGLPHSEIPGSKPACGSPRLIAACHVLLRLRLPRHPPCALSSLTIKLTRHTRPPAALRRPTPDARAISWRLCLLLAPPRGGTPAGVQGTHKILGLADIAQCYSVVKHPDTVSSFRSEERRVGKECRL